MKMTLTSTENKRVTADTMRNPFSCLVVRQTAHEVSSECSYLRFPRTGQLPMRYNLFS